MGVCFGDETEFGFTEFGYVGDYEVYIVEGKGLGGGKGEESIGREFFLVEGNG